MNITTFRQSPHVCLKANHVSGVKTRVFMSRGSLKIVIKYSFRIDLAHRMREKTGFGFKFPVGGSVPIIFTSTGFTLNKITLSTVVGSVNG